MPAGGTLVSHRTARSIVITLGAAAAVALLAGAVHAQSLGGIAGVVAPGVVPELVQEGFVFTEGPVGTPDGGLYFSDIRPNRIHYLDPGGKISLVREQTNGANGLALTRDGDLIAAEGEGKRISKRSRDGMVTTVTEGIAGKPFLSPNDVLVDAKGGIYITDPGPRPVVPGRTAYVYYLPVGAKEPVVLDDQIARPNGVMLTRDGKTSSSTTRWDRPYTPMTCCRTAASRKAHVRATARYPRRQGERRRRHGARSRGSALCHNRCRRSGVRCGRQASRHESRCRVSRPMRGSPAPTSACFTSRRAKVSIA